MEYDKYQNPQYPDYRLYPAFLLKLYDECKDEQQTTQNKITDFTIAKYIHLIIFQFRLYLFRADVECFVFGLLVSTDHAGNFVGLCPVVTSQTFLYLFQVPVHNTGYEHGVLSCKSRKVISGSIPLMVGIIFFWKEIQHLTVDKLVEDVDLFIQFHQIFVESGTLVRHFVICFFQLLL